MGAVSASYSPARDLGESVVVQIGLVIFSVYMIRP